MCTLCYSCTYANYFWKIKHLPELDIQIQYTVVHQWEFQGEATDVWIDIAGSKMEFGNPWWNKFQPWHVPHFEELGFEVGFGVEIVCFQLQSVLKVFFARLKTSIYYIIISFIIGVENRRFQPRNPGTCRGHHLHFPWLTKLCFQNRAVFECLWPSLYSKIPPQFVVKYFRQQTRDSTSKHENSLSSNHILVFWKRFLWEKLQGASNLSTQLMFWLHRHLMAGAKRHVHSFLGGTPGFRHPTGKECMGWFAQILWNMVQLSFTFTICVNYFSVKESKLELCSRSRHQFTPPKRVKKTSQVLFVEYLWGEWQEECTILGHFSTPEWPQRLKLKRNSSWVQMIGFCFVFRASNSFLVSNREREGYWHCLSVITSKGLLDYKIPHFKWLDSIKKSFSL